MIRVYLYYIRVGFVFSTLIINEIFFKKIKGVLTQKWRTVSNGNTGKI